MLPLNNQQFQRALSPRPSATAGRTVFTYSGVNVGIPIGDAPESSEQVVHDHCRSGGPRGWR